MEKQTIINKIIELFKNDTELFENCIEELDSYNGYLGDDRYYNMDMLDEFYQGVEPTEILTRAFYGRDDEGWETDASGNKIYGSFNPNRDYFYHNGYGNLVSCNYKDYSDKLDEYFIDELVENRSQLFAIYDNDELLELLDELENIEE